MRRLAGLFFSLGILCGSPFPPALAQDNSLTVFAAASMKNALDDIDAAYTAKTGIKVAASYAASSALAKQIEQGAPADIFVSADTDWMDYATRKKTIQESTRVNLLGNGMKTIKAIGVGGAGGQSNGQIGRVRSLQIGKFTITNPITLFSEDKAGAMATSQNAGHCRAS